MNKSNSIAVEPLVAIPSVITEDEKRRFQDCEILLRQNGGLKDWFNRGTAIAEIREHRWHHRIKGYPDNQEGFEEYIFKDFGIKKSMANDLIKAVEFWNNRPSALADKNPEDFPEHVIRKIRPKKTRKKADPVLPDKFRQIELTALEVMALLTPITDTVEQKKACRKLDGILEWVANCET